jgi:hypothetical protein
VRHESRHGAWIGAAILLVLAAATAGRAESGVLWQIGAADAKTSDLALGPTGYGRFARDGLFIVGRSKAREAWPYVHPGPADAWAGGGPHVFTAIFTVDEIPNEAGLRERGTSPTVKVELAVYDAHATNPPRIEAALNAAVQSRRLARGAGDASIMAGKAGAATTQTFEFPIAALHKGRNQLEIRNVEGSWFLYDAVRFVAPEGVRLGAPATFYRIEQVRDAPLLRRKNGQPTQVLAVEVMAATDAPASATFVASIEGEAAPEPIRHEQTVRPGRQWVELDVPRLSDRPVSATVAMKVGDAPELKTSTTLRAHRPWTVYLNVHSHVDIGYTELQEKVLALQKKSIVEAMDFAEQHLEFGGPAKFCWNVEVLWAVKDFLREANEEQRTRFVRHVREGALGLDALLANELTGLCTPEELAHLVEYAGELARRYDLTIDSAMITDVPGYSWGTAAVLAGAGVKYFDIGPNAGARIGTSRTAWQDRPFYWTAPDGKSRVLVWLSPFGYHRVFNLLEGNGPAQLLEYLGDLERNPDYPYEIARTRVCPGDNGTPPFWLSKFVQGWNARYESPKLVIGRTRDPFVAFEKKYGDKIPTYAGDYAPYWEDGAASSADETARNRGAAKTLEAAQKAWTLAAGVAGQKPIEPPVKLIDSAWDNVVLYDEHTWGAHNSITEPDAPFVRDQWKFKQAYALNGEKQANEAMSGGMEALASRVATGEGRTVVVFNPSSWERTDVVEFDLKELGEPFDLVDSEGKRLAFHYRENRAHNPNGPVAFHILHSFGPDGKPYAHLSGEKATDDPGKPVLSYTISFIAREVPPLGYRTYRLVPMKARTDGPMMGYEPSQPRPQCDPAQGLLQSPFFEIRLDKERAGASVSTARPGKTISSGDFNRYLYCRDGDPKKVTAPENVRVEPGGSVSPDGAALAMYSSAPGCNVLEQTIEAHAELPWLDITNRLDRGDVRVPEGVYFDFPFDGLENPEIRYETAWAPVKLESDLIPGSCKNFFCAQHYVEVRDANRTVVLAPIDAPLIEIGEIHPNTRKENLPVIERLKLNPARVLSFVMNNYWFTNYRASQPGRTTFRYRLYCYEGNDPVKTARFGMEAREPLRAVVAPANNAGPLPRDAYSFAQVRPDNVVVTSIAPAANGGILVRLNEIAGKSARATLTFTRPVGAAFSKAERVDLWQRPIVQAVQVSRNEASVEIGPREVLTLRAY